LIQFQNSPVQGVSIANQSHRKARTKSSAPKIASAAMAHTAQPGAVRSRHDMRVLIIFLRAAQRFQKITPDRSKIVIEHEDHVKYWTRILA
jgi:hypothetical protein